MITICTVVLGMIGHYSKLFQPLGLLARSYCIILLTQDDATAIAASLGRLVKRSKGVTPTESGWS